MTSSERLVPHIMAQGAYEDLIAERDRAVEDSERNYALVQKFDRDRKRELHRAEELRNELGDVQLEAERLRAALVGAAEETAEWLRSNPDSAHARSVDRILRAALSGETEK